MFKPHVVLNNMSFKIIFEDALKHMLNYEYE